MGVSSFACPGIGNVGKFDAQQTFAVRPNTIDPIKRNMADSFREHTARASCTRNALIA